MAGSGMNAKPRASTITLEAVNSGDETAFVGLLGHVFENSPWVAARTAIKRPFATRDALNGALVRTMLGASEGEKIALIRAHPELAGNAALSGAVGADSKREQASAGLDRVTETELSRFRQLNHAYRQKFGFPFVIAVRDHSKASILTSYEERLGNSREEEIDNALRNIARIVILRVQDLVEE